MIRQALTISAIILVGCSQADAPPASAEPATEPAHSLAADTQMATPIVAAAEHPFGFMFGEWVGTASGRTQAGPYEVTQTERVGPMLDGDIIMINGTGYDADGVVRFEALGIISRTVDGQGWQMTSWSGGRQGTFPLTLDGTDYRWELPAGPDAKMVYSATVNGDDWVSVGTYERDGMDPVETFRMELTRTGDTGWPASSPVPLR